MNYNRDKRVSFLVLNITGLLMLSIADLNNLVALVLSDQALDLLVRGSIRARDGFEGHLGTDGRRLEYSVWIVRGQKALGHSIYLAEQDGGGLLLFHEFLSLGALRTGIWSLVCEFVKLVMSDVDELSLERAHA